MRLAVSRISVAQRFTHGQRGWGVDHLQDVSKPLPTQRFAVGALRIGEEFDELFRAGDQFCVGVLVDELLQIWDHPRGTCGQLALGFHALRLGPAEFLE